MSETYEAWDGNHYPTPAPEGWSKRSDGRWWPHGQGPVADGAVSTQSVPPRVPVVPPLVSSGHLPMSGPPVSGTPPPAHAPAKKKGLNTGTIVLFAFLGFLVLSVGGCLFSAATFFGRAGTLIEEGREEFDSYTAELEAEEAEALGQVSLDETTCKLEGLVAQVSGEVNNDGDEQYSYSITVQFTGSDNRRLDPPGFASVKSVAPGETIVFDVDTVTDNVDDEIRCTVSAVTRSEG